MDSLSIGDRTFSSRLFVGTGKFASGKLMAEAIEKSGTEVVTVALRRVDLENPGEDIMTHLNPQKTLLMINTSGATTAQEAIRLAQLAATSGLPKWVKIEVIPDARWLMPDPIETLEAARVLVSEGFTVLPYIHADPVLCLKLQEVGCAAVMPLAAPIGSNQGLQMKPILEMIIEQSSVPVIVDAGLGAPSHASFAMELGADAVLVNTAIATAGNPVSMAESFSLAVAAGRQAYTAGLPEKKNVAEASSPLTGFLQT